MNYVNTILWLKEQLWAWVLFGIVLMSFFFYIAKGLIVLIGGTFVGLYLYNIYGKNDNNKNMVDTTLNYIKNEIKSGLDNTINTNKKNNIEGFENTNYSTVFW